MTAATAITLPAPPAPVPAEAWGIPKGIYPQIYRGAFRGDHNTAVRRLAAFLIDVQKLGLPGVVFHGFPRELLAHWPALAKLAGDHGVKCAASWGLDGDHDEDGTILTAAEKGECMAEVLARPDCWFGLQDGEGAYETNLGPNDQSTPEGVDRMEEALYAHDAVALTADQSWFAIESHRRFPDSRFAERVRFRAPQFYFNDFVSVFGAKRYAKVLAWMERDWAVHEEWLRTQRGPEYVKPRTVTIQGYGYHGDADVILPQCLARYADRPVIMYCEPIPTDDVMRILFADQAAAVRGPLIVSPLSA